MTKDLLANGRVEQTVDDTTIVLSLEGKNVRMDILHHNRSRCAYTLTAAVFGLGAAAIATAAAATAITGGTILVAGVALGSGELTALAGMMGSWSAVYMYLDSKYCR